MIRKDMMIIHDRIREQLPEKGIITLIGPLRHDITMKLIHDELTLMGYFVFMPFMDMNLLLRNGKFNQETIDELHTTHNTKMLMSRAVLVVNPYGDIGHDTQREINFCKENDIPLVYLFE